MPKTTTPCESCNQPILFALIKRQDGGTTPTPLNLKPDAKGNIAATKDVHGVIHGRIITAKDGLHYGETRYMTHFATCIKASDHRKRDKPKPPKPAPAASQTLF